MSEQFDAYHKWLGIPPKDQPPHHYRLLGLEPFESDPAVIENGADQRMAHIRTCGTGKRAALSQQILNEISAAKLCLLRPTKKAYDQDLQARLASPATATETSLPPKSVRRADCRNKHSTTGRPGRSPRLA